MQNALEWAFPKGNLDNSSIKPVSATIAVRTHQGARHSFIFHRFARFARIFGQPAPPARNVSRQQQGGIVEESEDRLSPNFGIMHHVPQIRIHHVHDFSMPASQFRVHLDS